jgi:hypothetical protein
MKILALLLILSASLILFTTAADATQIRYKTVEQLGTESSDVVRGKVTSVQSYWNAAHTKIFTETVIEVDESYKGANASIVRLVQLGGEVDGVRVTVHGALKWRAEEEVVVFLEPYENGAYHVSGFSQGKFDIERDPDTGEVFVKRPSNDGIQLVGAPDDYTQIQRNARTESVPIDRFITQALGRRQGGEQR